MRAETQNCYAIHMSPNLSSVGKYESKSRAIIHRLQLGPLQMKIHSVISEIVKHELHNVAKNLKCDWLLEAIFSSCD
jgi:hypothetical protein